ncbi:hypothetical protein [Nitrosomonas ureae]|uniref:Uncharacterized protein n=1 Tax=Nitrosomonas ureae TaxID=44577 RepID=A0A1H5XV80_9PROT|nr:hypothetical protein [Nitrosomonas ureae]SEG15290.1 hypothetical protein SAMN05216334_1327 [Nitrosomonas ureae]
MRICKNTQPFVSKVRKELITVISEENKPLNTKEQKNGVITVITTKKNNVIDEVETVSTYRVVTITSLNCKFSKEVVTVTTQSDCRKVGNVSKNTRKPALNLETKQKLSTGKGKISSAILPVIKFGNVTGLLIVQSRLNDFDNTIKSVKEGCNVAPLLTGYLQLRNVAHLRGVQ